MKGIVKFLGGVIVGVGVTLAGYALAENINWNGNSLYLGSLIVEDVADINTTVAAQGVTVESGFLLKLDVGTVAPAGTDNTDAAAIVDQLTYSEGDGAAGLILPASTGTGTVYIVHNLDAASTLLVYPDASGQINGGTATTGNIVVAAEETAFFIDVATNTYYGGVAVDF